MTDEMPVPASPAAALARRTSDGSFPSKRRQFAKRELHTVAAAFSPPASDTRRLHSSRRKEL